ncbi:ABC transporter ATP-binding protein [Dyella sp. SG609]|uniref:ATP-binding cassette domain-containing protein n=1 Tax=Dyella sp. SG609 TaxID=2587018 RepID=UPI00144881C3|nr:ABC transporter ATP-binding protein [Dyella sp. SG609]NKJ20380.1 ATP-binding cassette subfamily C protein [Dyella sp. SG609]
MSARNFTDRLLPAAFADTLERRHAWQMAFYVVLSVASALAGSLAAVLLVPLVSLGAPGAESGFYLHRGVDVQAGAFVAAAFALAALRWWSSLLAARLTGDYGADLRRRVHGHLIHAPLAALADATSAEIANVLTYNIEIMMQGFSGLLQLWVAGLTCAISLAFAFWISPMLMLAVPLLALLGVLVSRSRGQEQARVSRKYVADLTRLFWLSEDFPRRLRHIRSFGREGVEQAAYGDVSRELARGYEHQQDMLASGRLWLELLAAAGIAAMFMLAHRLQGDARASLIAVSLLLGRLLPYLVSTRQSFRQLRSAVPAFELWRRYAGLAGDAVVAGAPGAFPEGAVLRIERVRSAVALHGAEVRDIVLVPGELTLIAGDSGAGKSSLADVLAGLIEPADFAAKIGGRTLDFDAYRRHARHAAFVSQHVRPWQATVRECLRWADPQASEQRMHEVLADVGLDRRLRASEQGLDLALRDRSSQLSGGELQRLLLAQLLLRRPFLAILDESTGALDAAAEIDVLAMLKRRLPQTMLLVISHRASVRALADRCVVLGGWMPSTAIPAQAGIQ